VIPIVPTLALAPWAPRLGIVLIGVAVLMIAIRGLGEFLARTHPSPQPPKAAPVPVVAPMPGVAAEDLPEILPAVAFQAGISAEVVAAVRAAVAMVTPQPHRIVRIVPARPQRPSVEWMMQVWSMEGRRQIYGSHNPR
jgi:Na+-transporting methylmalonyl-CoA/oxaloacetate decarboxylase gamma subunit